MADASDLPPEQDAVRRLLADARHDGPPPAEVVARLDETLAALVADRGSHPLDPPRPDSSERDAPVVDLASRRRRMAGVGLLAAASVVVAGVAIGQVLPRGSDDAGTAGADSSVADAPAEAGAGSESGSESESGFEDSDGGAAELAPESLKSSAPTPLAGYPTLSSTDEALDERVLELRPDAAARSQYLGSVDALSSCALPSLGQGRRLLAEVDGGLGVVVFRRPDGAAQQVELYVCGTADPVRTLTLPAP